MYHSKFDLVIMNAHEFLLKKGVKKVHQPDKKYNLSVAELIQFLEEYSRERNMASIHSITKTAHRHH